MTPTQTAPTRALIYSRISRDDTGEGVANERQEADCRKLADLRGWEVVGVERDVSISASSGKTRPAWERVLDAIRSGSVDVVVSWHVDRMMRSMTDLEALILLAEEHGVGIATVSGDIDLSTDAGRMVARILAAVARAEVERKGARQRAANRQRAAAGETWGSGFRAFGYELDGTLIEEEADYIRQAATDALDGISMRELARRWNGLGLRSVHAKGDEGRGWTARGIRSLLVNPRYAGIATYRGEPIGTGTWIPILTEQQHAQLKVTLTDPARRTRKGAGRQPEHLLSTVAVCSTCDASVHGRTSNKVPSYSCPANHVGTHREMADAYVRDVFVSAVRTFGPVALLSSPTPQVDDVEDIAAEVEALTERRATLTRLYLSGDVPANDYESGLHDVNVRLEALEAAAAEPIVTTVTEGADEYVERFLSSPVEVQRDALGSVLEVRLVPKGRGRRNVPVEDQVVVSVRLGDEWIPAEGFHTAA